MRTTTRRYVNVGTEKMYELTRRAGEAFPKKHDGIDLYCLQIDFRIRRDHTLNTARRRGLPNTIIWLDLGRLGSFGQTYMFPWLFYKYYANFSKFGPHLAFKESLGNSTNRSFRDALNLIRRNKREK